MSGSKRTLLQGTVFRGHLERSGSEKILGDIVVDVKKAIHFREFDPKAMKPSHLEYLVFGKGDELFLAHLITRPPDFDQILSVKVSGHAFTDAELGQGVRIIIPESTNSAPHKIKGKGRRWLRRSRLRGEVPLKP